MAGEMIRPVGDCLAIRVDHELAGHAEPLETFACRPSSV
jgi:hypothetical protein